MKRDDAPITTTEFHPGQRLRLPYRTPYDFRGLLATYRNHAVGNLETFEDDRLHRIVDLNGWVGRITVSNDEAAACVIVDVDSADPSVLPTLTLRVRAMFDLDVDPAVVARHLEVDPELKRLFRQQPGLRLPSGWDPFEIAIGTILGQFVSVEWARTLLHDLVELLGEDSGLTTDDRPIKLFPKPEVIAAADLTTLRTTGARKLTLKAFARAVVDETLSFAAGQNPEDFVRDALAIKGIGPWTAQYMAMRCLRDPDSFPASDLILARAIKHHPMAIIDRMKPWRGYAAALLWREYAQKLKKTNLKGRTK